MIQFVGGLNKSFDFSPTADVDEADDTIDIGDDSHTLNVGDLVVYSANGGDAIGGLEDGETYYIAAIDDSDRSRIALERAPNAGRIRLDKDVASGGSHTLGQGSESDEVEVRTEAEVPDTPTSDATGATDSETIPAGTQAFIGDATIVAGRHVDVDARERIDLELIVGGAGVGLGGGIGAGIGIVTLGTDVEAKILRGAHISADTDRGDGVAGIVSLDAHVDGDVSALSFAGGVAGIAALGAAVAFVENNGGVRLAMTWLARRRPPRGRPQPRRRSVLRKQAQRW